MSYTRRVVYDHDRPGAPSSSYTTSSYSTPTRQYVAIETPGRNSSSHKEESSYSKTYTSTSSAGGYPGRSHSESTSRNTSTTSSGGPGRTYSSSSEYRSGDGPGSHFSSCSYKSPYGNNYRNFSTR